MHRSVTDPGGLLVRMEHLCSYAARPPTCPAKALATAEALSEGWGRSQLSSYVQPPGS